jgi:hypothetical protein
MNDRKSVRIATFVFSQMFIIGSLVLFTVWQKEVGIFCLGVGVILHGLYGVMVHLEK